MDVVSTSAKFKKTQYPHYLFAVTVKNSGPCDLEKTKQKLLTKGYKRIFTKLVKAEVVGLNDYQLTYVFVWKPYELN